MSKGLGFPLREEFSPRTHAGGWARISSTRFNGFYSERSGAGQFLPTQAMSGQEQSQDFGVRIIKKWCYCGFGQFSPFGHYPFQVEIVFFSVLSDPDLFLESCSIIKNLNFGTRTFERVPGFSGMVRQRFLNPCSVSPNGQGTQHTYTGLL